MIGVKGMQKKKYQIFISSTYTDLIEARGKIIENVLNLYHFPIGMEMFSADNDGQWQVIKETIDQSDYYVVVIGGRYGSETVDGISFTEKEYDYATNKGIPVLAFIRDNNVPTLPKERDSEPEKIKKLEKFIQKVQSNKMCDFWNNVDDLGSKVAIALTKMFEKKPALGWIRADSSHKIGFAINLQNILENGFIQSVLRQTLHSDYDRFLNSMLRYESAHYLETDHIYSVAGGVPGLFTIMEGIFQFNEIGQIYVAFLDEGKIKYYTNDEENCQKIPKNNEMKKWLQNRGFEKFIYFCSVPEDKLKAVSGEYVFKRGRLNSAHVRIELNANAEIEFSGGANYGGNQGRIKGVAKLVDSYLALYKDDIGNALKFTFFQDRLSILEKGRFGGNNVSFQGEYEKI